MSQEFQEVEGDTAEPKVRVKKRKPISVLTQEKHKEVNSAASSSKSVVMDSTKDFEINLVSIVASRHNPSTVASTGPD